MNQEEETKVICVRGIELDLLLKDSKITMYNAHDLYVKYEPCWDCKGYNPKCDFFKSQYLLDKL